MIPKLDFLNYDCSSTLWHLQVLFCHSCIFGRSITMSPEHVLPHLSLQQFPLMPFFFFFFFSPPSASLIRLQLYHDVLETHSSYTCHCTGHYLLASLSANLLSYQASFYYEDFETIHFWQYKNTLFPLRVALSIDITHTNTVIYWQCWTVSDLVNTVRCCSFSCQTERHFAHGAFY